MIFFFLVYCGGCYIAAKEGTKFMERFKDKVRLNEVKGISMEDLDDALGGRRIFWMGPDYELANKRQMSVLALNAATPNSTGLHEIDIPSLQIALREAETAGTTRFRTKADPKYGAKAVKRATDKLNQAQKVQHGAVATLGRSRSRLSGPFAPTEDDGDVPEELPVPGDAGEEEIEEDFQAKAFEEEIEAAKEAENGVLVKMLYLASLKQIDTYKVDPKLRDKKGKVADPLRALYMICEAKGILHSYHAASRSFSRRVVKPSHSVPYYRLLEYGWQPSVSHTDFAGILNANALYSFTVGIPQIIFAIVFMVASSSSSQARDPAPCELDVSVKCMLSEDLNRPTVQLFIISASFFIGSLSLVLSISNIIVDFPAQLFDIAEKEEESAMFTLTAEAATKTWEDKLALEVQENVKMMLKMPNSKAIKDLDSALVIEDVVKLERSAIEKKVNYIEHYLTMTADEKQVREDLRDGKRKKKGEEVDEFKGEKLQRPEIPEPAELPPPRQPSRAPTRPQSLAAIPEPTPEATGAPSDAGIPAEPSDGALPEEASADPSASVLPTEPADVGGVDPNAPANAPV